MSDIILKKDIFEDVLLRPAGQYDKLCIVSAFASPSMARHHISTIKTVFDRDDISINLIVGMVSVDKIPKAHHLNFIKLTEERNGTFRCSYNSKFPAIHSKLYIWLKDEEPQRAFLTSANYTIQAFIKDQDEIATECNHKEAFDYYRSIISLSTDCNHLEAESLVSDKIFTRISDEEQDTAQDENSVQLPLFDVKRGVVQKTAGLNWGQRKNRNPNEAYIPIPSKIAKTDFFPPIGVRFCVLTEDEYPLICVRAQPKVRGGRIGFAIETPDNNSDLGSYFRNKLGLQSGVRVYITDLDKYGNRFVTFTKFNEDDYYMQFLKNQY